MSGLVNGPKKGMRELEIKIERSSVIQIDRLMNRQTNKSPMDTQRVLDPFPCKSKSKNYN